MSQNVFLELVAPSLGSAVAVAMFTTPMRAVLKIKKEQSLGDFNPIPLAVTCANCAAWIAYGYATKNFFMYLPNYPGFLLSCFMTFTTYGFADTKTRDRMVSIFVGFAALLLWLGICSVHVLDEAGRTQTWGYTCVFILLVFYAAPLSTLAEVVRTRNSASLYMPSSVMALANGALWVAYGVAVGDYFVWGPNLAGVALSVIQILMKSTYPTKPQKPSTPTREEAQAHDSLLGSVSSDMASLLERTNRV